MLVANWGGFKVDFFFFLFFLVGENLGLDSYNSLNVPFASIVSGNVPPLSLERRSLLI